jgi:tryptophanyl-tRNA synthetase
MPNDKKIILTGVKPTGSPHIGNYLAAVKPALELAHRPGCQAFYFIADYHAQTTVRDAKVLRQLTYEVAATWLAFGLDPSETLFYCQSDIPQIFELTWVLSCSTPKGLMNRAHAYKAKLQENRQAGADDDFGVNMGLYNYPILMAADILMFRTDLVPVGRDQVQHVEIARDIAVSFNSTYGDVLQLPQHLVREETAVIPGLDGRKMSKSYGNTIPLFLGEKELRKLVFRIKTDSSRPEEPKDPEASYLFQIFREMATPEESAALAARYREGVSWADAKQALFEVMNRTLAEPRRIYNDLMADRARLDAILQEGKEKAVAIAARVLYDVRKAVGIRKP